MQFLRKQRNLARKYGKRNEEPFFLRSIFFDFFPKNQSVEKLFCEKTLLIIYERVKNAQNRKHEKMRTGIVYNRLKNIVILAVKINLKYFYHFITKNE